MVTGMRPATAATLARRQAVRISARAAQRLADQMGQQLVLGDAAEREAASAELHAAQEQMATELMNALGQIREVPEGGIIGQVLKRVGSSVGWGPDEEGRNLPEGGAVGDAVRIGVDGAPEWSIPRVTSEQVSDAGAVGKQVIRAANRSDLRARVGVETQAPVASTISSPLSPPVLLNLSAMTELVARVNTLAALVEQLRIAVNASAKLSS